MAYGQTRHLMYPLGTAPRVWQPMGAVDPSLGGSRQPTTRGCAATSLRQSRFYGSVMGVTHTPVLICTTTSARDASPHESSTSNVMLVSFVPSE